MTQVIAHRGFSGKYPENSLLSIKKAVDLGVDWVEVDVWLSLDHRVFVFHDRKLDRNTDCTGRIMWKTYSDIRKCCLKGTNRKIPVLEEVFPLIKKGTKLNIEIKSMWAAKPVAELIEEHNMKKKVMISSNDVKALRLMKSEIPEIKTALIFTNSPSMRKDAFMISMAKIFFTITQSLILFLAKSAKVDYVHIVYPFATKQFVKRLHKKGYKVNVWAVNTRALMKKLIKNGVDGIISNYPDRLKRVIKKVNNKPKRKKRIFGLRRKK